MRWLESKRSLYFACSMRNPRYLNIQCVQAILGYIADESQKTSLNVRKYRRFSRRLAQKSTILAEKANEGVEKWVELEWIETLDKGILV